MGEFGGVRIEDDWHGNLEITFPQSSLRTRLLMGLLAVLTLLADITSLHNRDPIARPILVASFSLGFIVSTWEAFMWQKIRISRDKLSIISGGFLRWTENYKLSDLFRLRADPSLISSKMYLAFDSGLRSHRIRVRMAPDVIKEIISVIGRRFPSLVDDSVAGSTAKHPA